MIAITVQFRIDDEQITSKEDLYPKEIISAAILQRLLNRTASFDKLVEDDGDGDIYEQLHDNDLETFGAATFVDITFPIEATKLHEYENDSELVYAKSIETLRNNAQIVRDTFVGDIAHLSFK